MRLLDCLSLLKYPEKYYGNTGNQTMTDITKDKFNNKSVNLFDKLRLFDPHCGRLSRAVFFSTYRSLMDRQ